MPLHPNNRDGYAVTCDECHGRMFANGLICKKCEGDGRVWIKADPPVLTLSQRTAREAAWIVIGAAAILAIGIAALHWFRLL